MNQIPFYKMSGAGNDFIVIDNRDTVVSEQNLTDFIARLCRRKMSVGADGLILIEPSEKCDFRWRFFNSDGSKAEMCGNGARCAARFAYVNGIAKENLCFETEAGVIRAQVNHDRVKVTMPNPSSLKLEYLLELKSGPLTVSSINSGVPHVVVFIDQVEDADVVNLGREIRFHPKFAPAGTNANFVCRGKNNEIAIRTYERGVEDETLACGTGAIAGAIIAACQFKMISPLNVKTRSGEYLTIHFSEKDGRFYDIFMEGGARIIYIGNLQHDAWK
jgi:diaminopimelate epimerase